MKSHDQYYKRHKCFCPKTDLVFILVIIEIIIDRYKKKLKNRLLYDSFLMRPP